MIADIVGITGMTFLIVAYFLILFKKIRSDGYLFYFSNLIGALLLFTNALMIGVPWFYPLINTVWITGTVYQIMSKREEELTKERKNYQLSSSKKRHIEWRERRIDS
jgi:predicted membrane protein